MSDYKIPPTGLAKKTRNQSYPLAGMRVVDLNSMVLGPLATLVQATLRTVE